MGGEVRKLAAALGARNPPVCLRCDLTDDAAVRAAADQIGAGFGGRLDAVLHAAAFAPAESLAGRFIDTPRAAFSAAHESSAYSLLSLSRAAEPLLAAGAAASAGGSGGGGGGSAGVGGGSSSVIALSFLGADRAVAGYGVMGAAKASLESSVRYLAADLGPCGVRVNCISAGPVRTLASRGLKSFVSMSAQAAQRAPLRRGVTHTEVASTAVFLASEGASGITGQTIYVDAGVSIVA